MRRTDADTPNLSEKGDTRRDMELRNGTISFLKRTVTREVLHIMAPTLDHDVKTEAGLKMTGYAQLHI